jgi:hypothetical protein
VIRFPENWTQGLSCASPKLTSMLINAMNPKVHTNHDQSGPIVNSGFRCSSKNNPNQFPIIPNRFLCGTSIAVYMSTSFSSIFEYLKTSVYNFRFDFGWKYYKYLATSFQRITGTSGNRFTGRPAFQVSIIRLTPPRYFRASERMMRSRACSMIRRSASD